MESRTRSRTRAVAVLVALAILTVLLLRCNEASDDGGERSAEGEASTAGALRSRHGDVERGSIVDPSSGTPPAAGIIRGRLLHAGGRSPMTGVELCALRELDGEQICGRTGPEGHFALDVAFGTHRLALAGMDAVLVGCASDVARLYVDVSHDRPVQERELQAVGASQVIEGIVFDRHGGVVEGALVEPRPAIGLDEPLALDACSLTTTGEDGRFRLAVPAGSYALMAASSGYGVGIVDDARSGSLVEITLAPEARIRGSVVQDGDGRAVVGAEVRVLMEAGEGWQILARSTSDAGGRFAFDQLPAGRLRVEAAAERLFGPGTVVSIAPEEEARVDVRVATGAELWAEMVIGEDHRPCPMGQVELEHEALGLRFQAIASDEGIARIDGLPVGPYRTRAQCDALTSIAGPERLVIDGSTRETWVFAGGGAVRGQVRRGSTDSSAVGIRVVLLAQDPGRRRPVVGITDAHGELFVDGVAPGIYEVIAVAEALGEGPSIEVEEGQVARFVLDVPAWARIEGSAVDRRGNACHGMEVRAGRASGAFVSARVDAGGRYVLSGIEPGAYSVGIVGDANAPVDVSVRGEGALQVDLTCADHSALLRGRAVDGDGQPLADALVEATPLDAEDAPRFERTSRGVLTAADGAFSIRGLEEGRHLVTIREPGGAEIASAIANTSEPALVRVRPTGTIEGSLGGSGEVTAPIAVEVRRDDGAITRRVLVGDAEVPWRVERLPPGAYTIEARSASGSWGSAGLVVGADVRRVDVVLEPPSAPPSPRAEPRRARPTQ